MAGNDNDLRIRVIGADRTGCGNAISSRHLDIHDDVVRLVLLIGFDRFFAIGGFDKNEVWINLGTQAPHEIPHLRMIVSDENTGVHSGHQNSENPTQGYRRRFVYFYVFRC